MRHHQVTFVASLALLVAGCHRSESLANDPPPVASSAPSPPRTEAGAKAQPAPEPPSPIVLLAGGDVDLSRRTGQKILRDPNLDLLRDMRPSFQRADIRFANLESQVCDLDGVTVHPDNPLVFAAPPGAAAVLKRASFDVLSTANNHAWDFGKPCLVETIDRMRSVGIRTVGTTSDGADPLTPVVIEARGQKVAFFAMTAIFNDGPLRRHVAAPFVAYADMKDLARKIAAIRAEVRWVVASVHIGQEYADQPVEANRAVLAAAIDAGADVVVGHHPHTPQRVEFHHGKPIAVSLGNLVFHEHRDHPWTGWGVLARVTLHGDTAQLEACPYRLVDAAPRPLDAAQEALFWSHWDAISNGPSVAKRGARAVDGCVAMLPP
jgi:poly-gamma-glutamate capsule biosynthesis protein CapA/YwtB (metallophosphatase superfamily)